MATVTEALPAPAASLFARTKAHLRTFIDPLAAPHGWWLGGGSVLAAQWDHRRSTDLDVFLPSKCSLAPLDPRRDESFLEAMRASGAHTLNVQDRSIKVGFAAGRLEVTALDAQPPIKPRLAHIDGEDILLLQNASILTGKLYGRGMRLPARDVFDLCVAAERDPDALRCAVNHIEDATRIEIVHRLLLDVDGYRRTAGEDIPVPARQYAYLLDDGPRIAARLLEDEAYEYPPELRHGDGRITMTVTTHGGTELTRVCDSGADLASAMLSMGLQREMFGMAGTVERFTARIDDELARERGRKGGGSPPPP